MALGFSCNRSQGTQTSGSAGVSVIASAATCPETSLLPYLTVGQDPQLQRLDSKSSQRDEFSKHVSRLKSLYLLQKRGTD
jgi:hypothetical protein